ncbi:probable 2-carboxy-D-arabinitol-1-phosphatase isoform X2 [Amaranthus tricolor]|uniref:probable 2-carboxy-D-arabinitol-1-phosphatase isoform X2 n=1 Tax=Amaranthus tricolor TaxID=29722 RepID=UPI00258F8D90|nr:probable 2-carboxy-D-arabinitol-1-phosphatase isoform X2 [Amaranthus tricolor]
MGGGVIMATTHLNLHSITGFIHHYKIHNPSFARTKIGIQCSTPTHDLSIVTENLGDVIPLTGGALDFRKATTSLTPHPLPSPKKITLVRHGLSSWNAESRVQGSSDLSVLTDAGVKQAERCREALANLHFDKCFSSPISRAKQLEAEDAKKRYPKEYTTWREDPVNFNVNGKYPIRDLWVAAAEAWREILLSPGESFLIVTHKSKLRALVCTALGLGPERFRAIDINNGGICVFNVNKKGEAMLHSLNMTSHMYTDHTYMY